jgi:predicted nucleotidyltransferase
MTRSEILTRLEQYKKENATKYGISSMGIFGSYANGIATDESDVDIVIETQCPDVYILVHIKEELEELFSTPVDIVRNRATMNPYLKKRIDRDAHYV